MIRAETLSVVVVKDAVQGHGNPIRAHTGIAGDGAGVPLAEGYRESRILPPAPVVEYAAVLIEAECVAERSAVRDRLVRATPLDRKSTRLHSSHTYISYAVFWLKKKKKINYILQNSRPPLFATIDIHSLLIISKVYHLFTVLELLININFIFP